MGLRYIIRAYSYGGANKFFKVFIKGYLCCPFGLAPFTRYSSEEEAKEETLRVDKLATFESA